MHNCKREPAAFGSTRALGASALWGPSQPASGVVPSHCIGARRSTTGAPAVVSTAEAGTAHPPCTQCTGTAPTLRTTTSALTRCPTSTWPAGRVTVSSMPSRTVDALSRPRIAVVVGPAATFWRWSACLQLTTAAATTNAATTAADTPLRTTRRVRARPSHASAASSSTFGVNPFSRSTGSPPPSGHRTARRRAARPWCRCVSTALGAIPSALATSATG